MGLFLFVTWTGSGIRSFGILRGSVPARKDIFLIEASERARPVPVLPPPAFPERRSAHVSPIPGGPDHGARMAEAVEREAVCRQGHGAQPAPEAAAGSAGR